MVDHWEWERIKERKVTVGELMKFVLAFNEDAQYKAPTAGDAAYLQGQIELLIDASGLPMEARPLMAEQVGVKFRG